MVTALAINEFQQAGPFARHLFLTDGNYESAYEMTGYNASLPRETWEMVGNIIIEESQQALVAVNDLRSRTGLLETVPLYVIVHTLPIESDIAPARQSLNTMISPVMNDLSYNHIGVPLPMVFEDTQLDMRRAASPLPGGNTIRSQWVSLATIKISQAHEGNLLNGNANIGAVDEQLNLRTILGYTTHPQRNSVAPSANWDTFAIINTDFETYKTTLKNDFFYPPYIVYVGTTVWSFLTELNLGGSERTFRELLLQSPEIEDIKFSQDLAADELVMIALRPAVVTWVQSADIQAADWDAMGIFGTNIRMWSIAAPFVKTTYANRSGIVHSTSIAQT